MSFGAFCFSLRSGIWVFEAVCLPQERKLGYETVCLPQGAETGVLKPFLSLSGEETGVFEVVPLALATEIRISEAFLSHLDHSFQVAPID